MPILIELSIVYLITFYSKFPISIIYYLYLPYICYAFILIPPAFIPQPSLYYYIYTALTRVYTPTLYTSAILLYI